MGSSPTTKTDCEDVLRVAQLIACQRTNFPKCGLRGAIDYRQSFRAYQPARLTVMDTPIKWNWYIRTRVESSIQIKAPSSVSHNGVLPFMLVAPVGSIYGEIVETV